MSFVTLSEAKLHLRVVGAEEDALIALYLSAAERAAVAQIQRNVYADDVTLAAAIAVAPTALSAALDAYQAAVAAAQLLPEPDLIDEALRVAELDYFRAKAASRQTHDGIVVVDEIKSAVLLMVGHLYSNREDVVAGVTVTQLPNGAQWLLQPYRVYA